MEKSFFFVEGIRVMLTYGLVYKNTKFLLHSFVPSEQFFEMD